MAGRDGAAILVSPVFQLSASLSAEAAPRAAPAAVPLLSVLTLAEVNAFPLQLSKSNDFRPPDNPIF
jgi:hypothetical protein